MNEQSEAEFTDFVNAQWFALFRTAFLLTGDHQLAEDLLQSALVRLYLAWPKVRGVERPDGYARKIVANQAASWWRRRSSAERPTLDLPEVVQAGFADSVAESYVIWSAVLSLPPRQRAVVVLRYYEDMTEDEIADALRVSRGAVKSHAHAARAKLAQLLAPAPPAHTGGDSA